MIKETETYFSGLSFFLPWMILAEIVIGLPRPINVGLMGNNFIVFYMSFILGSSYTLLFRNAGSQVEGEYWN